MTKLELITLFQEATELSHSEAKEYLHRLGDIMATALLTGNDVPVPGVGKLVVKETAARVGRNPKTGERIDIPAGRKVVFRVSKELKASLA